MQTKNKIRRANKIRTKKVIRGGLFSSYKPKPVLMCDTGKCENLMRVAQIIYKSSFSSLSDTDKEKMGSYFNESGSYDLLKKVEKSQGLTTNETNNYKVILMILRSLFKEKGYYTSAEKIKQMLSAKPFDPTPDAKLKYDCSILPKLFATTETLYDELDQITRKLYDKYPDLKPKKDIYVKAEKVITVSKKGFKQKSNSNVVKASTNGPATEPASSTATELSSEPATEPASEPATEPASTPVASPPVAPTNSPVAPTTSQNNSKSTSTNISNSKTLNQTLL